MPTNANQGLMVRGRVLRGADLREYAERHGLCKICALYQTHKRVRKGVFGMSWEPISVQNDDGVYSVYKGYCIQPTCYTSVDQVKELLGEIPKRTSNGGNGSRRLHSSHGLPASSSPIAAHGSIRGPVATTQIPPGGKSSSRGSAISGPVTQMSTQPHLPSNGLSSTRSRDVPSDYSPSAFTWQNQNQNQNSDRHLSNRTSSNQIPNPPYFNSDRSGGSQYSGPRAGPGMGGAGVAPGTGPYGSSGVGNGVEDFDSSIPNFDGSGMIHSPFPPIDENQNDHQHNSDMEGAPMDDENVPFPHRIAKNDIVVGDLATLVADGEYITFLNNLDRQRTEARVVVEGLRLFRYYIVRDQLQRPNGVVLAGDNWVKTIGTKVEQFLQDRDVVCNGLLTLLTFSVLRNSGYRKSMVKKGAIDFIFRSIEEYKSDQEIVDLGCSIICSLSHKDALTVKYAKLNSVIRRMADIIATPESFGKDYAVISLSHISNQRKKHPVTNKSAATEVRLALAGERVTNAIMDIVNKPDVKLLVKNAAMDLLWKLSSPRDDESQEALPVSDELMETLLHVFEMPDSAAAQEAVCGLLANLALRKQVPEEGVRRLVSAICGLLLSASNDDSRFCGCALHALSNLLASSSTRKIVLGDAQAIPAIVGTLARHGPEDKELVEYGCLALSHAARSNQAIKEAAISKGAFELIEAGFEHYVTSLGEDAVPEVKDATLCAMATLSACEAGAQQMVHSGLLDVIQDMVTKETDTDFKVTMEAIVKNAETGAAGGFSSNDALLRDNPESFASVLESAGSEAEVVQVLVEFRELGKAALVGLANGGFDTVLGIMSHFEGSAIVQEQCCALLAETFFHLPPAGLDAPTRLPNEAWVVVHKRQSIESILLAMARHRGQSSIQNFSCLALYNFLAPFCDADMPPHEKQNLSRWVEPCLKAVYDALSINAGDVAIQKVGIEVFVALCMVCLPDDIKRYSVRIVQQMFDALRRYPQDYDMIEAAFDALSLVQDDQGSLDYMGNSAGIGGLMSLLRSNSPLVAARAASLLASLLKKSFFASSHIMQMPDGIQKLIYCMSSHHHDPQLLESICSVFETLINIEDYSVRGAIGESGGLHCLCDALGQHTTSKELVEKACTVLSLIIPCISPNTMASMRTGLSGTLILVLEENVDNAGVEAAVMGALYSCCGQDEYFKHVLMSERCIRAIIQSMALQLGSSELQISGCSLLWILSGYGNGKQLIGDYGGVSAVVNGMLAHNESTAVQKEGLTALKSLATSPNNKRYISSAGGDDAVQYALRIHFRDPQVLSGALSAMNNIAVDSQTKTVALMPEDIVTRVMSAMKRFPHNEALQKNACFYLKSCSYLPANIEMMAPYRNSLIPLLLTAADNFPNQCANRAQSIVNKIQEFRQG